MNDMKKLLHKKQQTQQGFTLVETLVAISILLVAIVGPMTIAARGLQTAFYAREQITAFMLAQEGVELVRMIRDQNALRTPPANWLSGIPGVCRNSNNGCGMHLRNDTVRNCNSQDCRLLYDDRALGGRRGFYNYAAGTESPFTRQIWVRPVSGGNTREAEVTVTVSWRSGLFVGEKEVTLQSRIFNQYDNI